MNDRGPFYNPTAQEVAFGWLFGQQPAGPVAATTRERARGRLEAVVRGALLRQPCFVAFSGGRDSSAVLAVALHVARRECLPEPTVWTHRFPSIVEAQEDDWQQLVIDHLRPRTWHIEDMTGTLDALGEEAIGLRRSFGPLWPPVAWTHLRLLAAAEGGSVLTGEGGDNVFDLKRMSLAHNVVMRRGRVGPGVWRATARAVAPARLTETIARHLRDAPTWLQPSSRHEFAALSARDARAPLRWDRATEGFLTTRSWAKGRQNLQRIADGRSVELVHPLADEPFVRRFAADGGWLGVRTRTAAMHLLFADLLPDALLRRSSKASFGGAVFGPQSRDFAHRWDGAGVDPALVDAGRLKAEWLSDRPSPMSLGLLQQAFVAEVGSQQ